MPLPLGAGGGGCFVSMTVSDLKHKWPYGTGFCFGDWTRVRGPGVLRTWGKSFAALGGGHSGERALYFSTFRLCP